MLDDEGQRDATVRIAPGFGNDVPEPLTVDREVVAARVFEHRCLSRIMDQHSTAGRAPSRVGITRTVPPGRSAAVRGYPASTAAAIRLGSYRIATAPEPNSSRLISFKSSGFDSPANNVGPWPATLGCTTNSYSSINPNSARASGSVTPPTNTPLPDCRLSCPTAFARSPRKSSAFQSTWLKVLDTTYF